MRQFEDVGEGKCLVNGQGPDQSYHHQDGENCAAMCSEDPTCVGFSESNYGNCILYIDADGNSVDSTPSDVGWGQSHCMRKVDLTSTSSCEELCIQNSDSCMGYSFIADNGVPKATCYLF